MEVVKGVKQLFSSEAKGQFTWRRGKQIKRTNKQTNKTRQSGKYEPFGPWSKKMKAANKLFSYLAIAKELLQNTTPPSFETFSENT